MKLDYRASIVLAWSLLAGSAALAQGRLERFEEIPGVKEFTGSLIARPMPVDLLAERLQGDDWRAEQMLRHARAALAATTLRYYPEVDEYILRIPVGMDENSYAAQLLRTGAYQYVHPNYRVYPCLSPNDPSFGSQWHHFKIESPRCWDQFRGSASVVAAVCDTGIDLAHPDLAGRLVSGYNSVTQLPQALGGQVTPVHPHGTHVAGIIGAVGNNSIGVSGVNWDVRIMPIRVSDVSSGSASYEQLTRGARWAAENGAKVINTSYSGVDGATIETTGAYCRGLGAVYLYAAGNDNRNLSGFDHPNVTVVGASTSTDGKASFSAYGLGIDVFAPGTGILSTTPGNSYAAWDGTSMATPVAAGVCAMMLAAKPGLTPGTVEDLLESGCDDLGTPGNDSFYGWGRVNVYRSVAQAVSTIKQAPANGFFYERVTRKGTWPEAQTGAAARSVYGVAGRLACLTSATLNSWVVANFESEFVRGHWLGGTQPAGSGEPAAGWSWVSGAPWSYNNWSPGQPDNAAGVENSLEFFIGGVLGSWNDVNGATASTSSGAGYFVEYPVPPPSTVSGTVLLQRYLPAPAGQQITITVRPNGGAIVETQTVTLGSGGTFAFVTPWKGNLTLGFKGVRWLRKAYVATLGAGNLSGIAVSLVNGDVNSDNRVDSDDFDEIVSNFGASGTWADLDGSGTVDSDDFDIVVAVFGTQGDP